MRHVVSYILFVVLLIAWVCLVTGCQSKVTGGTSRHDTGAFNAEVPTPSGIVRIHDDRETVASTQPTVSTNTGNLPQVGKASEGEIGAVSFQQVKSRGMAGGFALAALFAAVAAFAWFVLRRPVIALLCAALAVVSLLFPLWLGIGAAVVAVGAVLYLTWGHFRQIVGSVSHAMDEVLSPGQVPQFKKVLQQVQDRVDQKIVEAVKPQGA